MGMWSGGEGQQFPKWEPPGKGRPKYLVPAGTKCAIRNVLAGDWTPYTTVRESGFEKYERYDRQDEGNFYEFRLGVWLMLVHRKYVVHREAVDEMERRLRMAPEYKPRQPRQKKKRRR